MLVDLHLNQFIDGILIGLVLGILVGTTWEHAYEMIVDALQERKTRPNRRRSRMSEHAATARSNWLALLLAFTSVMMIGIGVFQVYSYSRMSNFIQCQAQYNQESAQSRSARTEAQAVKDKALYAWIKSLPKITSGPDQPATPKQIQHFHDTLAEAIRTYNQSLRAQHKNPYPEDPQDTCGSY